jgi:pyruvate/2-oxoglutarate dehydrogenase complex dihydrolipoamide acyltransferase (E2) component
MSKFNQKLNEFYYNLLEADASGQGLDQTGGQQGDQAPAAAPAPAAPAAPAPAPEQEAQPMTPEGKVFLIELALKALAVDSSTISEQDKSIFETHVTKDNADQVADRIRQIVEGL